MRRARAAARGCARKAHASRGDEPRARSRFGRHALPGRQIRLAQKKRDLEDAAPLHASRNCPVRPPGEFAKFASCHCRVVAGAEPSNRSCLARRHPAEYSFRRRSFAASARRAGFLPFAQAICNRLQGPYATPAARFVGVRLDVREAWGKSSRARPRLRRCAARRDGSGRAPQARDRIFCVSE